MAGVIPTALLKFIVSIPGHVMKLSLLMALWKVEITGEKAQPWRYLPRSVLD